MAKHLIFTLVLLLSSCGNNSEFVLKKNSKETAPQGLPIPKEQNESSPSLELQKLNEKFNSSDQYLLTKAELDFLLSEGAITASDYQELMALVTLDKKGGE